MDDRDHSLTVRDTSLGQVAPANNMSARSRLRTRKGVSRRTVMIAGLSAASLVGLYVPTARLMGWRTVAEHEPQATGTHVESDSLDLIAGLELPSLQEISAADRIRVVEDSRNISLDRYLKEWPWLAGVLEALRDGRNTDARRALMAMLETGDHRAAALNVLAQLDRRDGNSKAARKRIDEAIQLAPEVCLHHYQDALLYYKALTEARNPLTRWKLSTQTQAAYQRAFDRCPDLFAARYYLIQCFELTPTAFGGDRVRALRLADEAIEAGMSVFLPVRGRLRQRRDQKEEALQDFDQAIQHGAYEREAFVSAISLVLEMGDNARARRYAAFAVVADPDSVSVLEAVGDFFVAVQDHEKARRIYKSALKQSPGRDSAKRKLDALRDR